MSRKVITVEIDAEGRDKGKTFQLTEMSASKAEKWAMRAFLALARGGLEIPEDMAAQGLAGIARMGAAALSGVDPAIIETLMEDMWLCVQIAPDPKRPHVVRNLIDDDVEEIKTRLQLRKEIIGLHIDFFTDAALLTQARSAVAATLNY